MNLFTGENMTRNPHVDPRNEILEALGAFGSMKWPELHVKSQLSKGALSKHLNGLINEGRVHVELEDPSNRRSSIYSLPNEGRWEYRRNKITKFFQEFDDPMIAESIRQEGKFMVSFALNLDLDISQEEKERAEKKANDRLNSWYMKPVLDTIYKFFVDIEGKGSMTFLFDPEGSFSPAQPSSQ